MGELGWNLFRRGRSIGVCQPSPQSLPRRPVEVLPHHDSSVSGRLIAVEAIARQFGRWRKLAAFSVLDPRRDRSRGFGPPSTGARGWSGTTLLRVEVLANGIAGAIEIVRSSGYRLLDEASVEAVRGWKFHPARRNQQPVRAWVELPITFALQKA